MKLWLMVSVAITLATLAASFWIYEFRYASLPERIPVHFDWRLEPDAWVSKDHAFVTFFLIPIVMGAGILLTVLLPWLSPRPFDVDRFRGTYAYVMTLVIALMGFVHFVFLWTALYSPGSYKMGRLLVAGSFLFVALAGNVLGKIRRNFWMGVRTPWTLASEAVWIQTHRLAAWLFVGYGVAGMIAILLGVPPLWCVSGLIGMVIVPAVYSAVLYKRLERRGGGSE